MNKVDLVEIIHNELGFPKKESTDLLECVISIMKQTLESGEDIKITGFGKFEVKQKNDRKGRNPATGDTLIIEARKIVTFKTSSLLKSAING